eukprot:868897-Rhodomonas_salina.1
MASGEGTEVNRSNGMLLPGVAGDASTTAAGAQDVSEVTDFVSTESQTKIEERGTDSKGLSDSERSDRVTQPRVPSTSELQVEDFTMDGEEYAADKEKEQENHVQQSENIPDADSRVITAAALASSSLLPLPHRKGSTTSPASIMAYANYSGSGNDRPSNPKPVKRNSVAADFWSFHQRPDASRRGSMMSFCSDDTVSEVSKQVSGADDELFDQPKVTALSRMQLRERGVCTLLTVLHSSAPVYNLLLSSFAHRICSSNAGTGPAPPFRSPP